MNNIGRSYKILFIFLILLISLILCNTSSMAGPIDDAFKSQGKFKIDYDTEYVRNNPVVPFDSPYEIPITISHRVVGPYAEMEVERYTSQNDELNARIHVEIFDCPAWCKASIIPDFVVIDLSADWSTANATIYLTVDENAPAFKNDVIKLKLWGDSIGLGTITIPEDIQQVEILTGFAPIIKFSTPSGTAKTVQPGETTYFDVELENYGNGKTVVLCDPVNVPKGWTVEVQDSILLGSEKLGDNPKKILRFTVYPPDSFGYHEERKVIQYSLIPTFFNDSSVRGEELELSFVVQSRGFSTPGFEMFTFVVVILGFIVVKKLKSRRVKK